MNYLLEPNRKFIPGEDWVHYTEAVYGEDEINAVIKCLRDNWLGNGKLTDEFEEKVSKIFGKKYGLFVNSGSSAILLAFEILNFPPGSEVITPACTFGTTVSPIIKKGLIPVFVDSKIPTYNIDINLIEAAITNKTKAIIVPHAIGNINDMKSLRAICDKHGLKLIEDSCDTIGSLLNDKPTGIWSDITVTSFYASHNITAGGGGGMLMVDDKKLKDAAKIYRDWGRALPEYYEHYQGSFEDRYNFKLDGVDYDGKFTFSNLGYNMKGVEMQAAFGLAQLNRLDEFNKIRKNNFKKISDIIEKYDQYFILPETLPNAHVNWLALPITIKEKSGLVRKDLLKFLELNKIQTRLLFAGNILKHPAYQNIKNEYRVCGELTNADTVLKQTFLMGVHHGLTDEMIAYVENTYKKFFSQSK